MATDRVIDRFHDQDPAQLFVLIAGFMIVAAAPIIVVLIIAPPRPQGDPPVRAPQIEPAPRMLVDYTSIAAGYGFSYPSTWELSEVGTSARLESPGGNIVVSFGFGGARGLLAASEGSLEAMPGSGASRELIGTKRERIAGFPSLMAAGTATDESGRPIRFLAIAIRGDVRTYAVSIVVPAGSDPTRVLPRVERIVASLEILDHASSRPTEPRGVAAGDVR